MNIGNSNYTMNKENNNPEEAVSYTKEVEEILSYMHEDWMDGEDKVMVVEMALVATGKTRQDFENDLRVGVSNGYSVEKQMEVIKVIFSKLK